MKTLTTFISATAIAASLIGTAGLASAQTAPTKPSATDSAPVKPHWDAKANQGKLVDTLFEKLDPQKTGAVTIDAYLKGADERFDKIDTKKQGYIDRDELTAYVGTAHSDAIDPFMKRFDAKGDGKITKDEFEKPLRKRFALIDINDDGKITREEAELAGPMLSVLMPRLLMNGAHGHAQWHNHDKPVAQ
jgi:hypothetical protein